MDITAAKLLTAAAAFVVIVYLALSGGGYDIVLRSEIGILIWWAILLGALVGVLPRRQIRTGGWVALTLLTAFLAWSWIGLSWTSSHEQTLAEVCRLSTYLGVVVLVLGVVRAGTAEALLAGLAAAIAIVCGAAVLSKLAPSLFPANAAASFYHTARLSYPFDYADAVGEFATLGVPLLLYFATSSRSLLGRGFAAAGAPLTLLCLAMTVSRGGFMALFIGVIVFFVLVPNRLGRLPVAIVIAAAGAALLAAVIARPALRDSLAVAPATQRHSLLAITLITIILAGAISVVLAVLGRRLRQLRRVSVSRRTARVIAAVIAAVAVLVIVAVCVHGTAAQIWHDFKQPNPVSHSDQYFRLFSAAGSHRYQYWQIALDAFRSSPWHGIGPGTFRFYWSQHQTLDEFVLNAHSLWIETLAETGVIGALLLVAFFLFLLVRGAVAALSCGHRQRPLLAVATATLAAFCAAAAFDWVWQIGVIPMVALAVAGVIASPVGARAGAEPAGAAPAGPERPADASPTPGPAPAGAARWRPSLPARALLGGGAVVALILIVIPLTSTVEVRASQAAATGGRSEQALSHADSAHDLEPGAASPLLQRALVLEQLGDVAGARTAIAAAIAREPLDAQLWRIASRIATESDRPRLALADYRRAHQLDPFYPAA
jgi:flagellar basal body-associated protein FliL